MTTPALCMFAGDSFSYENCQILFLTDTKKYIGKFGKNLTGVEFPKYETDEERFDIISDIFVKEIKKFNCVDVAIEGYAMGAKGRVFHIGENTGLLKHKLWKENINFEVYAPTAIKKSASGKGNAKKEVMYESFFEQTSIDLKSLLQYNKEKISSPVGDIVDSFFVCKHLFENIN